MKRFGLRWAVPEVSALLPSAAVAAITHTRAHAHVHAHTHVQSSIVLEVMDL